MLWKEYSYRLNKKRAAVRKAVLEDYDKVLGAIKYGRKHFLTVKFQLVILKLVEVNTKGETLKIDGWVKQKWTDGTLMWNRSKLEKTGWTRFTPDEIWVPDVSLMNNADPYEKLSGGPTKFITNVNCKFTGECTWLSPAAFTSSCRLNVRYWPMDTQVCTLTFGSWTYHLGLLRIEPFQIFYKKGSISNGEWIIDDIEVSKVKGLSRSLLNYKVTLTRKPIYVLFYLGPPAVILVILAVMSFFIPTDSGERISFVTTILLAKMVFLLMMPEYLPKTSDALPILGILLILSMLLVAVVLIGTIFVLACHHKKGTPSMLIQKLLFPFKFLMKKHPRKPNKKWLMRTIQKVTLPFKFLFRRQSFPPNKFADGAINQGMETEMQEADTKNIVPIDDDGTADQENAQEEEEEKITWQEIAKKLNSVFLFTIITAILMTGLAVFLAY